MPRSFQNNPATSRDLRLPLPRLAEISFDGEHGPVSVLTDGALLEACGTRVGFSGRHGGVSLEPYRSLNLSRYTPDEPSNVEENRRTLLSACGAGGLFPSLVMPKQVHGDTVLVYEDAPDEMRSLAEAGADAIVCATSGVPVVLSFADCVPVVLVAPGGAFAVVHSGWRGTYAGISGKALSVLCGRTGAEPRECNAYIGPHICSCCYEVDGELLGRFVERFGEGCDAGGSHLSLDHAVEAALLSAGASRERIANSGVCTSCHVDEYFSHRAENGKTGRHGAFAFRKD